MQDDASRSWRVETGGAEVCRVALFVRDAAGLEVEPLIPRLSGVPVVPVAGDLSAAARQWTSWWQQVLELEFADPPAPGRGRARFLIARREAVCDPPEFAALAGRPELQAVARAVVPGLRSWPEPRDPVGWALLKQTAEDVAFDRRVPIDRVRARIRFLPVDGLWWTRVAPGCVMSSVQAAEDPGTAQTMLQDAFVSGLTR